MKLNRWLNIIFLTAAALLAASAVVTYWVGTIAVQSQQKMERNLDALKLLSNIGSTLKDTETGQRGYLLTGEDRYLEPYTRGLSELHDQIGALQQLAGAGELPRAKVDDVVHLSQQKETELAETIRLRREKGLDAAMAIVRSDRGQRLMEQIRSDITDLQALAQAEFERSSQRAWWTEFIRTTVFGALTVFNLLFLVWAYRKILSEAAGRAAAALEVSRQRELLATTLASIGDGVIVTDREGRVTFLNREAEALTGWKLAEAVGNLLPAVFRIINEKTRQPAENPVEKVFQTGKVIGLANHTVLISKSGLERPIDDSAAPIRQPDGELFGAVLVFRDATEHRRAQTANARLAAIIEHSGDVIISKNLDGIIQTWNPAAEQLFGYKPEEIIGKPVTTLFPPERLNEEDHILALLREGKVCERFETVRVRKDGQRISVAVVISPIKDEDGTIVGASKVVHDISEIVATREALQEANRNLENKVRQRTAELRETVGELESVAYSIAHDIRAPLRSLQGYGETLRDEYAAKLDSTARHYIQRITSSAGRMDSLVQDVLNYSRVGRADLPMEPLDVEGIVRGILESYPQFTEGKATVDLEGPWPRVIGNNAGVLQCFSNLLDNAVKFIAPDVKPHIRVWSEQHDSVARFFVKDNGIGIAPSQHERIFGIFERVNKNYEGTGIGLAIVKKSVERMGGKVGLESNLGSGSTFWIELRAATS